MKSRHFILAALVALVTFAGLRAAARHRRWQGRAPWSHRGSHRFFGSRWNWNDEAAPGFGPARPAGQPAPVPIAPVPVAPSPSQPLPAPADTPAAPQQ